MRGLGWVRDSAGTYPFVAKLIALAAQVKLLLPDAKLTYAADWSEYFGHQPGDGSGDVYFHLDPLWADANIDAVAIDNYWPLSDWRDGTTHLDYQSGTRFIHDLGYLKGNIEGGEGLRLVLCQRRRPRQPDAHADHGRRGQALGVPL